jgi:hypothetical protein
MARNARLSGPAGDYIRAIIELRPQPRASLGAGAAMNEETTVYELMRTIRKEISGNED